MGNNDILKKKMEDLSDGNLGAATALVSVLQCCVLHEDLLLFYKLTQLLESYKIPPPYIWSLFKDLSQGNPYYFRAIILALHDGVISSETLWLSMEQRRWTSRYQLEEILSEIRRVYPDLVIKEMPS